MPKVRLAQSEGDCEAYVFHCQGCGHSHLFYTRNPQNYVWQFNGNLESPTFTPSLRNTGGIVACCHLNLTDGKVYYHDDCTHSLKGQTVELPEIG